VNSRSMRFLSLPTTVLTFARFSPAKWVDLGSNRSVSTRISTKRRTLKSIHQNFPQIDLHPHCSE
jgi:hypothetical protein